MVNVYHMPPIVSSPGVIYSFYSPWYYAIVVQLPSQEMTNQLLGPGDAGLQDIDARWGILAIT